MLRIAYNTNGFAHHTLPDILEILAELGFDGVALTLDVHHLNPYALEAGALERLRGRLAELGLACVIETGGRFLLDRYRKHEPSLLGEGRERRVDFLKRAVDIAAALGAEAVGLFSGRPDPGLSPEVAWRRLREGVLEVLDHARRLGVPLGFEPEPEMLVGDLPSYDRLVDLTGDDLGLTLDVGHVACTESLTVREVIAKYAARLVNVHIEDIRGRTHVHLPFGEGDLDFGPILKALVEARYGGLVGVELSRSSHDAPNVARDALAFLRATEAMA